MKLPVWLRWVLVLPLYAVSIVLLTLYMKFGAKIYSGMIGDGFFIDIIVGAGALFLISKVMYSYVIPTWKIGVSVILWGLFSVLAIIGVITVIKNTDGWEMWKHIITVAVTLIAGLVGIAEAHVNGDNLD